MTVVATSIFDKRDGYGADWLLMPKSIFKAAFVMLDGLPEDDRRRIAGRVHEGSYNRTLPGPVDGDSAASNSRSDEMVSALLNTAGLKSKRPRPPH